MNNFTFCIVHFEFPLLKQACKPNSVPDARSGDDHLSGNDIAAGLVPPPLAGLHRKGFTLLQSRLWCM